MCDIYIYNYIYIYISWFKKKSKWPFQEPTYWRYLPYNTLHKVYFSGLFFRGCTPKTWLAGKSRSHRGWKSLGKSSGTNGVLCSASHVSVPKVQSGYPQIKIYKIYPIISRWWFQPLWKILGNGKDYPRYYGKIIQMFQTTNQIFPWNPIKIHSHHSKSFSLKSPRFKWRRSCGGLTTEDLEETSCHLSCLKVSGNLRGSAVKNHGSYTLW